MIRILSTAALCIVVSLFGGTPVTPLVAAVTASAEQGAADSDFGSVTRARSLSIFFDIVPTPWADQAEVYDPNLLFLQFRGGIGFSAPGAVATATLLVDGTAIGSTTGDDHCAPLCSSTTWQFAAPAFPSNPIFVQPTIVDFAPIVDGQRGEIRLTVDRGVMEFAAPPYTANAPVVVFDYITCCTTFWPVTTDAQNLTYEVTRGAPQ